MVEHRYLEIIEKLSDEETLEKQPQILRVEVKDEEEAKKVLPDYEPLFADKSYKAQYHIHYHSKEGENLPCEIKILKEV